MPNLRFLEGPRACLARALIQAKIGLGVTLNPYIDFGHKARFITLGAGCVIAAGTLVNKDVPPNELWDGVPARFIRKLEEWSTRSTGGVPNSLGTLA